MAKMDERLEKMVERYREINDLMMQSDAGKRLFLKFKKGLCFYKKSSSF